MLFGRILSGNRHSFVRFAFVVGAVCPGLPGDMGAIRGLFNFASCENKLMFTHGDYTMEGWVVSMVFEQLFSKFRLGPARCGE